MLAALLLSLALFGQAPDAQGQGRRQGGQQTPGQQPTPATTTTTTQTGSQTGQRPPQERPSPIPEESPVITHHSINVGGKELRYTATVGMMPIKNRDGETEARIFFMAYTLDGVSDRQQRPLTFSFNGGPGSASVWLHMGALGPRRVPMNADGTMPAPPYHLVDNEHTWLDQSDLVFIDPVGTGYSRALRPEVASRFFSLQGDIESVGEFIRMYLTRSERWTSPLFLAGESYGTTRASALSGYLIGRGIAFNGIVLISTIMNFETTDFASGNDLPYVMYLPSYAATAWYHKKLPRDMQSKSVQKVVAEAEEWAANDYTLALEKGDRLTTQERQETIAKLSRYTGLSTQFIDNANLRVSLNFFRKELLRDEKRSIGRLDARFKGYYDMATPYFAVQYTLHHISIDPVLLKNFSTGYYEAGHMMYIDEKQLGRLRSDVGKFIDESQKK